MEKEIPIAVLIDADNVSAEKIKEMLDEVAKYGVPTYKRIYGNWTSTHLSAWKAVLLENAITPIQQYSYTSGKNATDSAMIIDAMDILYSGRVGGFCIVSSDSDFTRLAIRLRESGMRVIGIGERKTPKPFIVACDKFIYLEILGSKASPRMTVAAAAESNASAKPATKRAPAKAAKQPQTKTPKKALQALDTETRELIMTSVVAQGDETGWALLANVGSLITKQKTDFDTRNFGFVNLTSLIRSLNQFDMEERGEKVGSKQVYVRPKPDMENF